MASYRNLIDVQVNGFAGKDFSSETLSVDDVYYISTILAEKGTSTYLPTIVSSPKHIYDRTIMVIKEAIATHPICRTMIGGIHIEGPWISPSDGARGAHNLSHIIDGDITFLSHLIDIGGPLLKILTVAPEVNHIEHCIQVACERGVFVSMGHTMATHHQIEKAIEAGARGVTHIGNGIPSLLPRTDNPIFSFLSHPELTSMLITDGHHLPIPFIKTVIRTCTIDRIIVVSDSAPLAGMPPGEYVSLGGQVVLEPGGKLHIPSLGCLAGSSACLADCASFLAHHHILTEEEIYIVTQKNPAHILAQT